MQMVRLLYGKHYKIYPLYVQTADQGHTGSTRSRVYVVLAHRLRATMTFDIYDMYEAVSKHLEAHIRTKPSDYLVSSRQEVLLDAGDVARTRNKKFRTVAWRSIAE
jgi:hypothetical protein